MSLASLLRPLLAFDGLVAVVVLTRDGLPVEMIGHGLRADALAAEVATAAEAARRCFESLHMGELTRLRVELEHHEVMIVNLENHYLAIVFESIENYALVFQIVDKSRAKLLAALGG